MAGSCPVASISASCTQTGRVWPRTLRAPRGYLSVDVTSATHSPSLERSIALAYIRHENRAPGTHLRIFRPEEEDVITARVAELPFYKRPGKG